MFNELLNNIVKHSYASKIELRFTQSADAISLSLTDDGIGFDYSSQRTKKNSFGLGILEKNTRQINASLIFNTKPGKGCNIQIYTKL